MNRFSEKKNISFGEIAHPHNSGSAGRILLQFCTMKGANRQMRIIVIIFKKKKSFGADGQFWVQKGCIVIILDPL